MDGRAGILGGSDEGVKRGVTARLANGDRLDLDQRALRQGRDGERRAGRRRVGHEPLVDRVERREVVDVGQEARRLDDVGERAAGRVEHGLEVAQRLLRLGLEPPSASWPVAGSSPSWPAQNTRSSVAIAWLYGPAAAGAVARAHGSTGHPGLLPSPLSMVVAVTNGGPAPGAVEQAPSRSSSRTLLGGRLRVAERRIERPQRRTGAGQPDRHAEEPREGAAQRAQPGREDVRGVRQVVRHGEDAGAPDEVVRAHRRVARAELGGEVLRGQARRAPVRRRGGRVASRRPRRRPAWRSRARASRGATAGRIAGQRVERRHALPAALDEGGAAGEEERHVRAGRARRRPRARARRSSAPHASSAPSSAAAASLLPPARPAAIGMRFSRRAASGNVSAPRPTAAARLRDAREHGAEPAGSSAAGRRRPTTWRLSSAPGRAREAQPIREAERDHDRVELVEPVRHACRAPRA